MDLSKYGIQSPTSTTTPSVTTPTVADSSGGINLDKYGLSPTTSIVDKLRQEATKPKSNPVGNFITGTKSQINDAGAHVASDVQNTYAQTKQILDRTDISLPEKIFGGKTLKAGILGEVLKGTFRTAGDLAIGTFSPVTQVFGQVLGQFAEANPTISAFLKRNLIDNPAELFGNSKLLQKLVTEHPEVQRDIERGLALWGASQVKTDLNLFKSTPATPTIDIGGKNWTLEEMHGKGGTAYQESLRKTNPALWDKWTKFDQYQSMVKQVAEMKAKGAPAQDIADMEAVLKSEPPTGTVTPASNFPTSIKDIGSSLVTGAKDLANIFKPSPKAIKPVTDLTSTLSGAEEWQLKGIRTEVDSLFKSTKGIQNKVQLAKQKNIPIEDIVSEPTVFRGLKVEKGTINPDEAISVIENRIDKALELKRKLYPALEKNVPSTPKEAIRDAAYKYVESKGYPPADEVSMKASIDRQVNALDGEYGLVKLDELRAKFRNGARNNKDLPLDNEYSALENGTRNLIYEIEDNLPFDSDKQMRAVNTYIKNQIGAQEFLDTTIRGQKVKGGRLGKYAARTVGAIAGAKGGPLMSIAGSELSGQLYDVILNNQLGSAMKMRWAETLTDDPAILKEVAKILEVVKEYKPPQLENKGNIQTQPIPVVPSDKNIEFTGKGKTVKMKKPNPQSGAINFFSDMSLNEQKYLTAFAEHVKAGGEVLKKSIDEAVSVLKKYGYNAPTDAKKLADQIEMAQESDMFRQMNDVQAGKNLPPNDPVMIVTE
mgnify:CR=1 FL=1